MFWDEILLCRSPCVWLIEWLAIYIIISLYQVAILLCSVSVWLYCLSSLSNKSDHSINRFHTRRIAAQSNYNFHTAHTVTDYFRTPAGSRNLSQLRVICTSQHLETRTLTNYMEQSPSWEACSQSASQEILRLLWNPEVHYRVHNSPPLDPILSQTLPVNTHTHTVFLRSVLILSSRLRQVFRVVSFLSNILYSLHMSCVLHTPPISSSVTLKKHLYLWVNVLTPRAKAVGL
jgi:hypothetical protein